METSLRSATLQVNTGPNAGNQYTLKECLRIGRHPENDISINDPALSRRHVTFELTDEGIFLTDENSVNGTYINNRRVWERILLLDGDRIRIGQSEIVLRDF